MSKVDRAKVCCIFQEWAKDFEQVSKKIPSAAQYAGFWSCMALSTRVGHTFMEEGALRYARTHAHNLAMSAPYSDMREEAKMVLAYLAELDA